MADLSDYISELVQQGYDSEYIKTYLKQYGYKKNEIEQALAEASFKAPGPVRVEHHAGPSAFVFLILFLLVFSGVVFAILKVTGALDREEALLDVVLTPKRDRVEPGADLAYNLQILNLGSKDRFDATLTYIVLDNRGEVVSSREETFAVSTSVTRDKTLSAPEEPGTYTLRAEAVYDGKMATSAFTFQVLPEQDAPSLPETDASIEQARGVAETQPSKAAEICMQLSGSDRDDCLSMVVRESQRAEFCKGIENVETRDNCYMSFIVEGQTYLCSEVQLENNIDYCSRISDIQILAKYYQD